MSFFKPEDFCNGHGKNICTDEFAAMRANALLEAHLKTLPRVYGQYHAEEEYGSRWFTVEPELTIITHTALLWGVAEINSADEAEIEE